MIKHLSGKIVIRKVLVELEVNILPELYPDTDAVASYVTRQLNGHSTIRTVKILNVDKTAEELSAEYNHPGREL